MENIYRYRWAIINPKTQEIFCGLAKNYKFKRADCLVGSSLKTYESEKKAKSAFIRSWHKAKEMLDSGEVKIVSVLETLEFLGE